MKVKYSTIVTLVIMSLSVFISTISCDDLYGRYDNPFDSKVIELASPNPVVFSGLTADGTSALITTSQLVLTFNTDPTSLNASNISITGASKEALTGTGTTRTLAISDITVANGENITITLTNSAAFTFTPASRSVAVNVTTSVGYSIGNIGPSGVGRVFYVTNDGLSGLEAAPNTWNGGTADPILQWETEMTYTLGINGNTIGAGASNTADITGTQTSRELHPAATACVEYSGGGKNDWFLPSKDELNQRYLQKEIIGGFVNSLYWSSSQNNSNDSYAWGKDFSGNNPSNDGGVKFAKNSVRPIRAFPPLIVPDSVITFDNQNATTAGTESKTVTFNQSLPAITVPSKSGYTFNGYYSEPDGTGIQYYSSSGTGLQKWTNKNTPTLTLYAKWVKDLPPPVFSIEDFSQSGRSGGVAYFDFTMKSIKDVTNVNVSIDVNINTGSGYKQVYASRPTVSYGDMTADTYQSFYQYNEGIASSLSPPDTSNLSDSGLKISEGSMVPPFNFSYTSTVTITCSEGYSLSEEFSFKF